MSRVLVIGDLHLPAARKGYLEFCKDLYKEWNCNQVVFIGDVVDWHAISFWTKEPNCPGSADEYKLAKKCVKQWSDVFPKARVVIGNHDERPARLAKTVNIPDFMLKPYGELWETPGWKWDYRFIIDGVVYRHGSGIKGGIHPAWNLMNKMHTSVIIGHLHARAGIKWSANNFTRMFGMDVGCGIDEKAFQFIYGRDVVERPILAAGIVINGIPYHEIMPCSKGEKYHDSNFKKLRIGRKR